MNELIKKLMDNTDLDEKAAKKVLTIISNFAKEKLPGPIGEQVSSFLEGKDVSDVGDMLGGFFKK